MYSQTVLHHIKLTRDSLIIKILVAGSNKNARCLIHKLHCILSTRLVHVIFNVQIAVEGNIASGKTTLLNVFAKQYSAEVSNIGL